jgi:hypothetical protein
MEARWLYDNRARWRVAWPDPNKLAFEFQVEGGAIYQFQAFGTKQHKTPQAGTHALVIVADTATKEAKKWAPTLVNPGGASATFAHKLMTELNWKKKEALLRNVSRALLNVAGELGKQAPHPQLVVPIVCTMGQEKSSFTLCLLYTLLRFVADNGHTDAQVVPLVMHAFKANIPPSSIYEFSLELIKNIFENVLKGLVELEPTLKRARDDTDETEAPTPKKVRVESIGLAFCIMCGRDTCDCVGCADLEPNQEAHTCIGGAREPERVAFAIVPFEEVARQAMSITDYLAQLPVRREDVGEQGGIIEGMYERDFGNVFAPHAPLAFADELRVLRMSPLRRYTLAGIGLRVFATFLRRHDVFDLDGWDAFRGRMLRAPEMRAFTPAERAGALRVAPANQFLATSGLSSRVGAAPPATVGAVFEMPAPGDWTGFRARGALPLVVHARPPDVTSELLPNWRLVPRARNVLLADVDTDAIFYPNAPTILYVDAQTGEPILEGQLQLDPEQLAVRLSIVAVNVDAVLARFAELPVGAGGPEVDYFRHISLLRRQGRMDVKLPPALRRLYLGLFLPKARAQDWPPPVADLERELAQLFAGKPDLILFSTHAVGV